MIYVSRCSALIESERERWALIEYTNTYIHTHMHSRASCYKPCEHHRLKVEPRDETIAIHVHLVEGVIDDCVRNGFAVALYYIAAHVTAYTTFTVHIEGSKREPYCILRGVQQQPLLLYTSEHTEHSTDMKRNRNMLLCVNIYVRARTRDLREIGGWC